MKIPSDLWVRAVTTLFQHDWTEPDVITVMGSPPWVHVLALAFAYTPLQTTQIDPAMLQVIWRDDDLLGQAIVTLLIKGFNQPDIVAALRANPSRVNFLAFCLHRAGCGNETYDVTPAS